MEIAIIGAGACGLAFAEVFRRRGVGTVRVLEAHCAVGGTWSLSRPDSALYEGLRTNLPKELMAFSTRQFDTSRPSFIRSADVESYLLNFAESNGLMPVINLSSPVTHVRPAPLDERKWAVSWTHDGKSTTEEFDAVVVANGHFNKPLVPGNLENQLPRWNGTWMHSKAYRRPVPFAGQTVLVVGAKSSGADIARELDGVAAEVHVADTDCPLDPSCPTPSGPRELQALGDQYYRVPGTRSGKVFWRSALSELIPDSNAVRFKAGQTLEVDAIIFCTGYQFEFEFFPEGFIDVRDGKRVRSVYNELLHPDYTTLFLAGLNQPIVPFPFFEIQAEWAASMLLHPELLPPSQVRWAQVEALDSRIEQGQLRNEKAHVLDDQWEYLAQLAEQAQLPNLEALGQKFGAHRQLYRYVGGRRSRCPGVPDTYRDDQVSLPEH